MNTTRLATSRAKRHLVRDDHHRHALVRELPHDREDLADELGIKCRGHLIKEKHTRRHRERPCDRDALGLPSREVARIHVTLLGEADLREQRLCLVARLVALHAEYRDRPLHDVLQGGHVREQVKLLEYHPDMGAQARLLANRNSAPAELDARVPDAHAPGVGFLEEVDAAQQRRLAAAARTDDELRVAPRDPE